jgi:CheY-like chemotaxis protein
MAALRILIVDDNRDTADILTILLRCWGHSPSAVYSGQEALACVQERKPDVVLLGYSMPGLHGAELVRRIRQEPSTANALLVCITGQGEESIRLQMLEAGCDHFLLKAAPPEDLRQLLCAPI